MDLVLNNLQWLMCHKTKQNLTKQNKKQAYTEIVRNITCGSNVKEYPLRSIPNLL